ncbi:hypothetical protein RSSM_06336 [Rhodopirellula sallentina SM41]|uniref:Uncharacterized protein n=1 Tax=Rhodopirellula sallentina SM41 TaxID=1263870 RepID=M5TSR6_9BACT|nr:hypothetical protein RSSM_06336 [Rhodopirellula sallentina SM41]
MAGSALQFAANINQPPATDRAGWIGQTRAGTGVAFEGAVGIGGAARRFGIF